MQPTNDREESLSSTTTMIDRSHRVPQTELPISGRRASGRGQSLSLPAPEAPRRLHRLAALVSPPLRHYRSRPGVDDSNLAVSARRGYQAPVTAKASTVVVLTKQVGGGEDGWWRAVTVIARTLLFVRPDKSILCPTSVMNALQFCFVRRWLRFAQSIQRVLWDVGSNQTACVPRTHFTGQGTDKEWAHAGGDRMMHSSFHSFHKMEPSAL